MEGSSIASENGKGDAAALEQSSDGPVALKRPRTAAYSELQELWRRLENPSDSQAQNPLSVLDSFATWLLEHPPGRRNGLPRSELVKRLLPRAVALANMASADQLGSFVRFADVVLRTGYVRARFWDDDEIDSVQMIVVLVAQCAAACLAARAEAGGADVNDDDEERCFRILASLLSLRQAIAIVLQHLNLCKYVLYWWDVLQAWPDAFSDDSKDVESLAALCVAVIESSVFEFHEVCQLLPCVTHVASQKKRALDDLCDPALALVKRATTDCDSFENKAAAIRSGIFQCAWAASFASHPECSHIVFAWCYPVDNSSADSAALRKILVEETSALTFCISCVKKDGIVNVGLVRSILTFRNAGRQFSFDVKLRDSDDDEPFPHVFNRGVLVHDLIRAHMNKSDEVPPSLTKFYDCLNVGLEYELEKLHRLPERSGSDETEFERQSKRRSLWFDFFHDGCFRYVFTDYPALVSFDNKCGYLGKFLKVLRAHLADSDPIVLVVPKENVTDGVCRRLGLPQRALARPPSTPLTGLLQIEFRNDIGEDQGGLRRQWLAMAAAHFVRSDLFQSPNEDAAHLQAIGPDVHCRRLGGRRWQPAPLSVCQKVQKDWEAQFLLLGSVLGFAILHGEQVPLKFGTNFLKLLLRRQCLWEATREGESTPARRKRSKQAPRRRPLAALLDDMMGVDQTLAQKLKYLAAGNYAVFGVSSLIDALDAAGLPNNFTGLDSRVVELTGMTELRAGGAECQVTEANLEDFLWRFARHQLLQSIQPQADLIRHGMLRVLCPALLRGDASPEGVDRNLDSLLQQSGPETTEQFVSFRAEAWFLLRHVFSLQEFERLVCGEDQIDVGAWRQCTTYEQGYTSESQVVIWFWDVVETFSSPDLVQLLTFARGSSTLPPNGFASLSFVLRRYRGDAQDRLPVAHTCEFSIDLPEYDNKALLEEKLRRSIVEDSFGLA